MRYRAYAKINLWLEVVGKRRDGYHELVTILQTIDLHDDLDFTMVPDGFQVQCDDPGIPTGEDNLILKAARLMSPHAKTQARGVRVRLRKRIPAGRGLGGGSSDAAMTLLALNDLWRCDLDSERLHELAVRIGMDVPFFLSGGAALGTGRGECLEPLDLDLDLPILLISPEFPISTAEMYRGLRLTKRQASFKLQPFVSAVKANRFDSAGLTNDLEKATGTHSASIQAIKRDLLERGALAAMMSGSGSAVFGVFQSHELARAAAGVTASTRHVSLLTRTLGRRLYRQLIRDEVQSD